MNLTYNEILDEMKTAFMNEKGEPVKGLSDLEMRFRAVASEIYGVCTYGDFIMKQGFVQTASGEYLDRHAQLRSIERKTASFAKGKLTFSLYEALEHDVIVPKGSVCSAAGKPFIQFATDENAVIKAGETAVDVSATAISKGSESNAAEGTVTVMVNPPDYVYSVINAEKMTGGTDDESDEALRERILSSYSSVKNGVNADSIREMLLTLDEVTDAQLTAGVESEVAICLKTKSGEISDELKNEISSLLGFFSFCGVSVSYIVPTELMFNVFAEVKALSGYDRAALEAAVKEKITQFCSSEKIGKSYSASAIASACSGIDGVEYIDIFASAKNSETVSCGTTEYLKLNNIEVSIYG